MLDKTDYGGCPICDTGWKSRFWATNIITLLLHFEREHGGLYQALVEFERQNPQRE